MRTLMARMPKPLLALLAVIVLLGGYLLGNEYRYWRHTADLPAGSGETILLPKDENPRWSLLWAPDGDERTCKGDKNRRRGGQNDIKIRILSTEDH